MLLLASCDQNTASRQETATRAPRHAPADVLPPAPLAAPDTALPYRLLPGFGDSVQAPPLVRIGTEDFRVLVTARTDSARPLRYVPPPQPGTDPNDSTQNSIGRGFEGVYTFKLLRANGQPRFVRQLKKSDFKAFISEALAVESEVTAPSFAGYLPAFNALAFEISFYPPESDAGGQALVLLDAATGRVRHKSLARWTDGCNSLLALSANGRTLLSSTELLQANGHVTNLEKPGRTILGTLLINDQTALVEYGPGYDRRGQDVPLRGPNATLLDASGRVLKTFTLESIEAGLGSQILARYLPQTHAYYLFDEAHRQLAVVPRDQPTQLQLLKLRQMPPFRAPQRPTEVKIVFETETGTHAAFYLDPVSKQFRYTLRKPAY
ncbi:hypothetical protein JAO73_18510 [Hymenobacter sp. BT523]|uniref:hypothetical protein n=1 Tax=Hymenobacter sp. BT523 TaxID=2795725 RepID=UPI0018ECF53A|nr:hypothetical protein [Hymenobacter sp. BT523]MBJ6111022.1 hypothetical protein [Hymenobacter sp. BT523]